MDENGEDSVSEENRIVVERIKSAIDDIKNCNGLVEVKETTNHIKRNGDVLKDVDSNDSIGINQESDKCREKSEHLGNGDTCDDEKVSPEVESMDTVLNGDSGEKNEDSLPSLETDNCVEEDKSADDTSCSPDIAPDSSSIDDDVDNAPGTPTTNVDVEADSFHKVDRADAKTPDKLEKEEKTKKFILNDKIRNSLKGLQNKIKLTPDKRLSESEQDKSNGKSTGSVSDSDIVELDSANDTSEETEEQTDTSSCPVPKTNGHETGTSRTEDSDDVLLAAGSEGSPMEIGSDDEGNEDELLELNDETSGNPKAEPKCNDIKTNLSVFQDKIQFDEDSNSNSMNTTGNINEIVDFLNTDISNSKSPLTIKQTDDPKNDQVTIIDDEAPEKVETVEEETEKPKDSTAETEEEVKENNSKDEKDSETIVEPSKHVDMEDEASQPMDDDGDDDDVIICDGETVPDASKDVSQTKEEEALPEETESNKVNDDNGESCIDDDDDVIFEKEVKPSAGTDNEKPNCDNKQDSGEPKSPKENQENLNNNCTEEDIDTSTETLEKSTEEPLVEDDDSKVLSGDRKRRADSDSSVCEGESKRSRLDLTCLIGKLGSRVQTSEPASIEVTDSDEEEEEEEADDSEDVSPETETSDETEVKKDTPEEKETQKYIRITEKELEDLVRDKVKAYLKTQRDTLIVQLSQKVKELQCNNDLWKRQVKDLQTKVNDVTILQRKQEERKAKTDALRQITKRSVGLQVDDGRTSSGANSVLREKLALKILSPTTPPKSTTVTIQQRTGGLGKSPKQEIVKAPLPPVLHAGPMNAPPGSNGTIRLPIPSSSQPLLSQQISQASVTSSHSSGTSSVLKERLAMKILSPTTPPKSTFTIQQRGAGYRPPSVKSLLDNTRMQPTVSSPSGTVPTTTPTSVISLVQLSPRMISQNPSTQGYITVPQSSITQAVSKVVTKPSSSRNVTTIDLTDDDDASKTRVVTLPPGLSPVNPNMPGVRTVLPPGAQLIRSAIPNSQQTQYQIVFNSSSQSLRPTAVMTGMSSIPQTGTILQTIPQSSVVSVATQAAVTMGSPLTRVGAPVVQIPTGTLVQAVAAPKVIAAPQHPAPFPALPSSQASVPLKSLPPKPSLKISRVSQGIVLSWNMSIADSQAAEISNYQLFAYQETSAAPNTTLWKKVGDVKALPLPMACTLTQFQVGNKYHFAVRAMDHSNRVGPFSDPSSIHLTAVPATSGK